MATLMDIETVETRTASRRPYFSAIRWGAIFAGVVSGTATYLLLSLLGVAVGLTAVDPAAQEPVGAVPLATGIWTGISMLIGAFVGGYVAGQMSGLARSMDGMLHGFVSWGATTLLYLMVATTALGSLLGGTFSIISQGMQAAAPAAQQQGGVLNQLMSAVTQQGGADVTVESLGSLQQAIADGDRERAIDIMVQDMGMERDTATRTVDRLMPLASEQNIQKTAQQATDVLTATSWWLFIGLLLSLVLGVVGGAAGARVNANRTVGDHTGERHAAV
jgi:hypothetical protein